ncbi:hypothetical protein ACLUEY_15725 [Vreelandella aquamarina]
MILDCSCYESSKRTLSEIFGTTEESLISLLGSISPYDNDYQPPEKVIYSSVCDNFGVPEEEIDIIWFHGTRVEDEGLFYEKGILPKSTARSLLEPRLKELSEGLERSGQNPFSLSLFGKQGEHDEGPFAFLIRDAAIHAPGAHHRYVEVPEMVEDISGTLLGENYIELVNRFQEITNPFVVSFISCSEGYELAHALWYLKLIVDGEEEVEAASIANTCFCGNGKAISPEKIQAIEAL